MDVSLFEVPLAAVAFSQAAGAAGSSTFEVLYLLCALVGLIFTVLSFLMSGVFEAGDAGDHAFDAGGHADMGGHADAGFDHGLDHPTLGPVSPTTISMFITSFGAVGYLALVYLDMKDWYVHLPLASAAGFGMAALIFWVLYKVFQVTVSSSEATVSMLPGTRAEVITAIPEGGLGEIAYSARGTRFNAPARTADGKPLKAFSAVRIERVVGGTCVVLPVGEEPPASTPASPDGSRTET